MTITKLLCVALSFAAYASAIWPIPTTYTAGNSTLWIDQNVQIIMNGSSSTVGSLTIQNSFFNLFRSNANTADAQAYGSQSPSNQIIEQAISRTKTTLFKQNFVPWKFHPRNADFEPKQDAGCQIKTITLALHGDESVNIFKSLAGEVDESYTLDVTTDGHVEITAKTAVGISHGLTTFTQLFYKHSSGCVYSPFAPTSITDAPKFPHRGINMDVARNYFPLDDIKRQIDAAAYVKMNRFHIHITDGQSWPLVIPALPELSEKGAYRKDLVYTPENVKELQLYGAVRGVQVFLETDLPGHTSSIHYSHPELIASFNKQPDWDTYAAEPPSGTLKLNSPAVDSFLETMFHDLLPRLKDFTSYYHTGGDEVNLNAYLNDDTVRSNDTAVLQPLMQKFIDRNHDQIRAAGFAPIVWQEMLLKWNLTLGEDVVVQTWMSNEAVLETVQKGHKALTGNYNNWVCLLYALRKSSMLMAHSTSTAAPAHGSTSALNQLQQPTRGTTTAHLANHGASSIL